MSIAGRVFNFMIFIWLAGGLCITYPEAAKYPAVAILVVVVYSIPLLRLALCFLLTTSMVYLIITEVWQYVAYI